jgi:probable selenate reductase FAD-binding subunit
MKRFDYLQPDTLREAHRLMEKAKGKAKYIAGGTDLMVHIKTKAVQPDALVSLTRIQELSGMIQNEDLVLGSMTLLRDIERDALIGQNYSALGQAASALATPQIRNVATVGGNLCNSAPSADCAPPLLVLEARLTVEGPGGQREVAIEDFFTGPGETCMDMTEILTKIRIQRPHRDMRMAFLKLGRVSTDIAIVNAAVCLTLEKNTCRKCRLAVGAVAPVPLRLSSVEKMIEGQEISDELLNAAKDMAEEAVNPITDVRSTQHYRRIMSGVLVKRVIEKAVKGMGVYS